MSKRRSFESTPLIEAVIDGVRQVLTTSGREPTLAEVFEWVFLDVAMYGEGSPSWGRYSPVLRSTLMEAYTKVGGTPGDMSGPGAGERPYRGRYSDRTRPR